KHPNLSKTDLHTENKKCWDSFYSMKESYRRTTRGNAKSWPLLGKLSYLLVCVLFRRAYAGYGMAADSLRRLGMKAGTRWLIRTVVGLYNVCFRRNSLRKVPLALASRRQAY